MGQPPLTAADVKTALEALVEPKRAEASAWFFKTDKGGYGEHDTFIGVAVPNQRRVAKAYRNLDFSEVATLLQSPIHEHRLTAVLILTYQFEKADDKKQGEIYQFVLEHTEDINNWDIVDTVAPKVVGAYLLERRRDDLYKLARSGNLWQERIAVIATQALIRDGQFNDTLKLAEQFMDHQHDLIHKAAGWMLREVGNRDEHVLTSFLDSYATQMPRTMLRYAIEKLPEKQRKYYLQLKVI